jgi:predicted acylesterase/phospholipase RssA
MTIKHLVFSGGGPVAIKILGILRRLEENNIWNINNIESIYGTSAGVIMAVILCLRYDWDTIKVYFIERPWNEVFNIKPESVFNMYNTKGVLNIDTFIQFFKPLFDAKNIPLNITLQEFYDYSKVDLHLFSVEVNEYKLCEISHKTHPSLSLITAVYMSCAIPILFSPVCIDNKCYVDGGMLNNYPIKNCLNKHKKEEEILAFKNEYIEVEKKPTICEDSNLFDYITCLMKSFISSFNTMPKITVTNEIKCKTQDITFDYFDIALNSECFRKELYENGLQVGEDYIPILKNNIEPKKETKETKESKEIKETKETKGSESI